jgi:hypothetical protein
MHLRTKVSLFSHGCMTHKFKVTFKCLTVNYVLHCYLYRELVDAECYRLAYEFVCQLLQPSCTAHLPGEAEDRMVLPCQSFCREFHAGCGNRLPDRFKDALDCRYFPEFTGPGSCNSKPGN